MKWGGSLASWDWRCWASCGQALPLFLLKFSMLGGGLRMVICALDAEVDFFCGG